MNKYPNAKQLALSLVAYSSASIFGPLIVFGGIGLLLDKWLGTRPLILIVSVFVAFIFTNVLLFKKIKMVNKIIDKYKNQAEKKPEAERKEREDNK